MDSESDRIDRALRTLTEVVEAQGERLAALAEQEVSQSRQIRVLSRIVHVGNGRKPITERVAEIETRVAANERRLNAASEARQRRSEADTAGVWGVRAALVTAGFTLLAQVAQIVSQW